MKLRNFILPLCFGLSLATTASAQSWLTPEVEAQADALLRQMTTEEKLSYISGTGWMYTKGIDRLGIPVLKMSDGPQGLGTHGQSTAYPATVMLAATWNDSLALQYGTALGRDSRARGVNILLGPAVNIYRAAMCGRNFEYMGEDPYLAARTAVGYIKGVQSQGVMATVKHFTANNSDYDRDNISNDIDERTLHEIYFPAFKAAVQQGEVAAVMTSYNLMNGIYTTENPWLLRETLRDRWGFQGVVMSDWNSLHYPLAGVTGGLDLEMPGGKLKPAELAYFLKTGHISMEQIDEKVRHILRVVLAFGKNKQDTRIPLDDPTSVATALKVAQEGIVLLKNERNTLPIDPRKTKHIIVIGKNANGYVRGGGSGNVTPFHYTGAFDGLHKLGEELGVEVEYVDELDFMPRIVFADAARKEAGLRAEYFNNLELKGKPAATRTELKINYSWGDGTGIEGLSKERYSVRWSGTIAPEQTAEYEFIAGGDDGYRLYIDNQLVADEWGRGGFRTSTIARTFEAGKTYDVRFEYFQDGGGAAACFTWKKKNEQRDLLVEYLNKADLVIACVGHNSDSEGEGRDRSFGLPEADAQLLARAEQARTPLVTVINAGGNVDMQDWEPGTDALLWAWYAGQESGQALADVLFGRVNPSGKLPMTFEKRWEDNPAYHSYHDPDGDKHVAYTEGIYIGYRGYDKLGREVQYPFGYGLSYTTFRLADMQVSDQKADGSVEVSCTLKNTGRRDGAQVVQVYVGKTGGLSDRPVKELKDYRKVFLRAGESRQLTFTLPQEAFTYYNPAAKDFIADPGQYRLMLAFSSRDVQLQKDIRVGE